MRKFNPRKKKLSGPSIVGQMKTVRIDAKTQILVPSDISDEEAIERYHKRLNTRMRRLKAEYIPTKKELKELASEGLI